MTEAATEEVADSQSAPPGMVKVSGGTFLYGRKKQEVTLEEFWIDIHPVTNADYEAFVVEHNQRAPRHWPPDGLSDEMRNQPIVRLDYAEAEHYATLLGKQLPTPAQYEKAARGTDGRKYPWGDQLLGRVSNTKASAIGHLTEVDAYPAGKSPCGCLDMAGNVLHWTRGIYDKANETRIAMGSSFRHFLGATYFVHEAPPDKRQDCLGFRCIWKPSAEA